MRAVVVANGDAGGVAWLRRQLAGADLVIAADGGAAVLWAAGRTPDLVVGDLDSLSPETRGRLTDAGAALESYPPEKDETDLELALRAAVERGSTEIDVIGALGGPRFDHALANVLLLSLPWLGSRPVTIVDPRHEVRLVRGPASLTITGRVGETVSLLPVSSTVEGIETAGLRYALREGTLLRGPARGVSNEMTADVATVEVRTGDLLVLRYTQATTD